MLTDVPQSAEARMGMLKECVLYVVNTGTIPMDVQQSVRRLDPVILDYIASTVEKTDTLPVGVKNRMMINPRTEIPTTLHSVRCHQLAPLIGSIIRIRQPNKNAINLKCSILIPHQVTKIQRNIFERWANEVVKRIDSKRWN